MNPAWYEQSYRRLLLDMHISGDEEQYLSQFDPEDWVRNLVAANVRTAMIDANGHPGLDYWPSAEGRMHPALKGRDLLGETIRLCRARGMDVVLYYCTIYVAWYWETHPEARTLDADGSDARIELLSVGLPRRFGTCCPNNSGYRAYVVGQLNELCARYDFDGVWPDMALWPRVCYCPACRERYAAEIGGEPPVVVNWHDPTWVRFQRARQRWMAEFAQLVTDTIRAGKPGATVAHQSGHFCGDWQAGASLEEARASDWLSADLYGDRHVLSFHSKLFYALSQRRPFEYLNAWCYPNIFEHVVTRSPEHIRVVTCATLMNHGAMCIIDAVDPLGTTNAERYRSVGSILHEVEDCTPHLGGRFCQDVAIYYSYDNTFDLAENGQRVTQLAEPRVPNRRLATPPTHRNAARALARTLLYGHVPYGVVTRRNLAELDSYQIVVLPNVLMLAEEEMAALRAYVRRGGSLLASKLTSLSTPEGALQEDFQLADLFGAHYRGQTEEIVTYLAPEPGREALFPGYSARYPVTLYDTQALLQAAEGSEVLARLVLPFTDPRGERYASIITDAPGRPTARPALLLHRYGAGRVLYAAGALELWEHDSQRAVLRELLGLLATRPFYFRSEAPKAVEFTLFHQPERQRYVLHALNWQPELPNIPVHGLTVRVWLQGRRLRRALALPGGSNLPCSVEGETVEVTLPRLEMYAMVGLEYA
jgi:hypothetical protein